MIGIVGEPKTYKSTFILQAAILSAQEGNPVYWIDRENGEQEISDRIMSNIYHMSLKKLSQMTAEEHDKKYRELGELPIYYCNHKIEFPDLKKEVDEIYNLHPGKHVMLIIDSLQSMNKTLDDIRLSIDEWLLNLDDLKLKHEREITMFIVCEKRRGTYGSVSIDSAKESGRIEYKLEQQLDFRYDSDTGNTILECTLNRFGPRGFKVRLQPVLENQDDPTSFLFKLKEHRVFDL